MRMQEIPSSHYVPAKALIEKGFSYHELKIASYGGGILDRWKSPKTRKVYYKNRNIPLFVNI